MSPELKEEIQCLKKIADNLHEVMHKNIKAYEEGRADTDKLKHYLHSCAEINIGRIDGCFARINELPKK